MDPRRAGRRWFVARLVAAAALVVAMGRAPPAAAAPARVAHVFVALCDNEHQGIVPVPAALGDGDDPVRNLYWGARYGVRTYLERAPGWRRLLVLRPGDGPVLERAVFRHGPTGVLLVADAYRGREIARALEDFLRAAAGRAPPERVAVPGLAGAREVALERAELLAYVGHDGFMDQGNPAIAALLAGSRSARRARPSGRRWRSRARAGASSPSRSAARAPCRGSPRPGSSRRRRTRSRPRWWPGRAALGRTGSARPRRVPTPGISAARCARRAGCSARLEALEPGTRAATRERGTGRRVARIRWPSGPGCGVLDAQLGSERGREECAYVCFSRGPC
jgi:hypothetical protein